MTLSPDQVKEWERLAVEAWRKILVQAMQEGDQKRVAYARNLIKELTKEKELESCDF